MSWLMKAIGFTCLLTSPLFGQLNMVVNHSFEEYNDTTVNTSDRIEITNISAWSSPHDGHPEVYTSRGEHVYDDNGSGWPFAAKSGKNVAGINIYENLGKTSRDYLQGQLSAPLEPGKRYHFSFGVHYHCSGANNIGIVFLPKPIKAEGDELINLIPVTYQKEIEAYDEENTWALVEGEFTARRSYENFIIGNFFSNEDTQLEATSYRHYFAYIDDVSVREILVDSTTIEKTVVTPLDPPAGDIWARNDTVISNNGFTLKENIPLDQLKQQVNDNGLLVYSRDGFRLKAAEQSVLKEVATNLMIAGQDVVLEIHGHASGEGTKAYNQKISEQRAREVAAYLKSMGVLANQLEIHAHGETQLRVRETSEKERAMNRRVNLKIKTKTN